MLQLTLRLHAHGLHVPHLDAALVVVALLRIRSRGAARYILVQHHHLVLTSLLNEKLLALHFANCALHVALYLVGSGYSWLQRNDLVHSLVGLDAGVDGFLIRVLQ